MTYVQIICYPITVTPAKRQNGRAVKRADSNSVFDCLFFGHLKQCFSNFSVYRSHLGMLLCFSHIQ